MFLLRHGEQFVVAYLHIAETDKDAVGYGAIPDLGVIQRQKPDFVQIRLHVQKQTGPGYEIHLQNVVRQWYDICKIPSFQM